MILTAYVEASQVQGYKIALMMNPVPGFKMTHEVIDGDSAYQCGLAPDVELVGKFETGFIAVRYENGAVVFVPKRMVKKQAKTLHESAETITDEQRN